MRNNGGRARGAARTGQARLRHRRPPEKRRPRRRGGMQFTGPNQGAAAGGEEAGKVKTVVRDQPKVGRNDPCPCGSGKKYKKCHGATL